MNYGKLYLIPTPISGTNFKESLVKEDIKIVSELKHFIVETPKVARQFLSSIDLEFPIQEIEMKIFDEHSDKENLQELLQPILLGNDMGLMTDAGTPCIADPGEEIVLMCHKLGIETIPMIGPSSIFLTLMASGLNAERFAFSGYLPKKPKQRQNEINKLVGKVLSNGTSQIFIEAPYRNQAMFDNLLQIEEDIYLCLGIRIGSKNQEILTMPISEWRKQNKKLEKVPIIYIIGR
ncbi:MAG: SAM-dependent methyltransferase [Candidatus Dojkabacteria bacterium]|nr:SAM-dependent methyltransferase [Candidatus Dojkabacteria bacterium]